jgi:hypothetical protein
MPNSLVRSSGVLLAVENAWFVTWRTLHVNGGSYLACGGELTVGPRLLPVDDSALTAKAMPRRQGSQRRVRLHTFLRERSPYLSTVVAASRRSVTISSYPRVGWLTISHLDPASAFLSLRSFSRTALAASGCSVSS